MRKPSYVRELTTEEREALEAGLRASEAFTVRRCQILLASAEGQRAPQIAQGLRCNDQTVRNAIVAFHSKGLAALTPGSSRPQTIRVSFDAGQVEQLKELLHQSPRHFDQPTSVWTLKLAAEVAYGQGLISQPVSDETLRQTLKRHGISWRRAKEWSGLPGPIRRTP